jgi:hypothetical protein
MVPKMMKFAAIAQTSLKSTFVQYGHPHRKPRSCPGKSSDFACDGRITGAASCAYLHLPMVSNSSIAFVFPPFSNALRMNLALPERQFCSDSPNMQRHACNLLNIEAGPSIHVLQISRYSGNGN